MISRASAVVIAISAVAWLTACSQNPQEARQKYIDSGNRYFAQAKYAEAIVQYKNAIKADASSGDAHLKLADAYDRVHDRKLATAERVRAARLMPGRRDIQLTAGRLLLLSGQYNEANGRAQSVLDAHPRDVEALLLSANATAALQDFEDAQDGMELAFLLDPRPATFFPSPQVVQADGDRLADAEKKFRQALEADPGSVSARLALAHFYWSRGRVDEAARLMNEALSIDGRSAQANRALAVFGLWAGRQQEGLRRLEAALASRDNPLDRLTLADCYALSGRADRAASTMRGGAAANTTDADALGAAVEYDLGRRDDARRHVEDAARRAPHAEVPLLAKARILARDGKVFDAIAAAESAASSDGQSVISRIVLGRLAYAAGLYQEANAAFGAAQKLDPGNAAAQVELARLDIEHSASESAISIAKRVTESQPANAEARLLLAQAFGVAGDTKRADEELALLAPRYQDVVSIHLGLAAAAAARHRAQDASKEFQRALALDPSSVEALSGIVGLEMDAKRPDQARALVESYVRRSPGDTRALMLAARTYAALKDNASSEKKLEEALRIEPQNVAACSMLARLYLSDGRVDEARARYEDMARRDPSSATAETMLGVILQAQDRAGEAQKHFERALKLDPHAAIAANNLAWLYAENNGNLDQALQLAQTAKEQMPDRAEVNDTLGWIYLKKGLVDLAVPPLERSVEAAPDNPTYRYHLGMAYLKTNQQEKARRSLEQALRLKSDFAGAEEARKVLAGRLEP